MKRTDTKQWKEFVITDFFVPQIVSNKLSKLDIDDDGFIPVQSSESINNGILGYTVKEADFTCENNEFYLIFGDHTKSTNIADYSFCVMDNVKVLKAKIHNKNIALFIITVWKKAIPDLGYARHWRIAKEKKFKLPVDETGKPNFSYMESYMKKMEITASSLLNDLQSAKDFGVSGKLELNNWKPFKIVDLFTVKNTHSILKSEIVEDSGTIPYVTASNENNGVYSYVDYYDHLKEEGNCIMIGGKTLTITYQKGDFFSNDSHNLTLYLKDNTHRTEKIHLFLLTALRASIGHSYSWGDSISFKSIQKDYINLPVDSVGNPDYSYMEGYIANKFRKTEKALHELVACI